MGRGLAGTILKLMRARDYRIELTEVGWLCPTMRKLSFRGPEMFAAEPRENGEFLRFWFRGVDNPERQYQRGYTLLNVDKEAGTFDVYVLIHQPAGPASTWALNAKPGEIVEVTNLNSKPFEVAPGTTEGVVFFADAASMPYVVAGVQAAPAELKKQVFLQVYHDSDREIPFVEQIQAAPNTTVEWLAPSVEAVQQRIAQFDFCGWNPHVLTEAKVTQAIRSHLLKTAGLDKSQIHAHAYWARGKAMGKERTEA